MAKRILVTARAFWANGKAAQTLLEEAGYEVVWSPRPGPFPEPELIPLLAGCEAVIASSEPYNAEVFAACPELKVVSRCGVGTDSVNMAEATAAGVVATNTPGAMTEAVADYTFALLLGIARHIPESEQVMRAGEWKEAPGTLLFGKALGLVGFGQIGQAVARRAAGFSMYLLVHDPPMENKMLPAGLPPVQFCSLDKLLADSDFVSLHAPSLPETRGLFDATKFAQMKPTAYFINTARGALVDEDALCDALENGTIAGAATDVYRTEPCPADARIRHAPNCVLTPHNAFNTTESAALMSHLSAENILLALNGKHPQNTCNPDVWNSPALRI